MEQKNDGLLPFNITEADIGRYVREISTGEIGIVKKDRGNGWIFPAMCYEWKGYAGNFEYVEVTRPTPAPLSKGGVRSWYLSRVDGDSGEIWYELHDVTDEEDWQIAQNSFIKFMGLKAKDDCNAYAEMLKARGDSVI